MKDYQASLEKLRTDAAEAAPKNKPSRTDQTRQAAEEYAGDQREIIKNLRERLN